MKALFKFARTPDGSLVIDTTSSSGNYRGLSPFILSAPPAKNFENLWQFSKVYPLHWNESMGIPNKDWGLWSNKGYQDEIAHRYPMGKGTIPVGSWWNDRLLDYIEARKQIYAPEYAKNVQTTTAFANLKQLYIANEPKLVLLDYDAYDHQALGMTLKDVINNPDKKMGHAFVLMMMLKDELEECIKCKPE